VAYGEAAFRQELLDILRQAQEPEHVGDRCPVLAGAASNFLVAEAELPDEPVEGEGHFDWVEILALEVLDEGEFQQMVVGDIADDDRDLVESGKLGGAPAPLARD